MPRTQITKEGLYDPDVALQSELNTVKDNQSGNFVAATMNNYALWQRLGREGIFVLTAARNRNVSNSYLRADDQSTNQTPFVLPFSCELVAMSLSTSSNESWTAEIRVNGSVVSGATLSVSSAKTAYSTSYSGVNFSQGDGLQLYCNGSSISRPRVMAFLRRTA